MNDKQEAKFQELTGQPVGHLVCKMAAPTIISMMVTACYNMVDTYFVGQLHSNSATGAVGVVFSLMAVIQAVGLSHAPGPAVGLHGYHPALCPQLSADHPAGGPVYDGILRSE